MAKYFIQNSVTEEYLQVLGVTANQTKYGWTSKLEDATNFRYQVSAFKQLNLLKSTRARGGGKSIVLKEEYKGKIFEVANLEIEE